MRDAHPGWIESLEIATLSRRGSGQSPAPEHEGNAK
jgi:hypothetical protein